MLSFLSSEIKPGIRSDMTAFIKCMASAMISLFSMGNPDDGIPIVISKAVATALADRHFGIGCDQILVIRPSQRADIFMQIVNSDGSAAAACGNGTRCVADLIMQEFEPDRLSIETDAGILKCWRSAKNRLLSLIWDRFILTGSPSHWPVRQILSVDLEFAPVPTVCHRLETLTLCCLLRMKR